MGQKGVRVALCDASTGTRLGQMRAVADASGLPALLAEIRLILARFAHGVQFAVAVPDLLCLDLGFEHAGLQTALADLLRETLGQEQGLAVIELMEAKAIAQEMALTGGGVHRITPLFVEGEYRTDSQGEGGPRITLLFALSMADW